VKVRSGNEPNGEDSGFNPPVKVRSGNEPETGRTPGSTPFGGLFRV